MKKYSLLFAIAGTVFGVMAQNKLDLPARETLERFRAGIDAQDDSARKLSIESPESVAALVTVASAEYLDHLHSLGFEVDFTIGDMAMINLPLSQVEELAALPWVVQISFGGEARPLLDKAREASGIDAIHAADDADLNKAYTGKGVLVSVFDTGLDPNHINFMNEGGTTRVKGITVLKGQNASQEYYESKRQISSFTTENSNETHGTHVLGIAAGSYNGAARYAGVEGNMPYYGVATNADIVVGCGDLYNNCILKGVQYAVTKAKELAQPAVINLSLGSNSGSHDGKDSFGRTLNELGKDAIIVVAAGNEGDIPMGLTKQFKEGDTSLQTFPVPYNISTGAVNNTSANYNGTIEIYSSDSRPFKCSVVVYTRKGLSGEITDRYTVETSTSGEKTFLGGSATGKNYVKLKNFDAATSANSYLDISSNTDTYSKRYSVVINHTLDMSVSSPKSYLGLVIEGEPGQRINIYGNCRNQSLTGVYSTFIDRYITGWENGTPDGSINDMACGENVICIGSYNTRKSWPLISGQKRQYSGSGYDERHISGFSSYGTMHDGSTLPHVAAPGAGIISSVNGYLTGLSETSICGMAKTNSRNYHWDNMQGTSMSAPFAAGVFALWLEADPTLSVSDIKSIVKATSVKDSYVLGDNPARWGAGKLDALAGIKEVIRRADAGVDDILADSSSSKLIVESLGDNRFSAFMAGGKKLDATLCTISGAVAMAVSGDDNEVVVDASSMQPGVYVLSVSNGIAREATKILVK